jgi:hypothetical protein
MKTIHEYFSNQWRRYAVKNLSGSIIKGLIVLTLTIVLSACGSTLLPEPPTTHEPGQLTRAEDVFGTFYAYVPTTVPERPEILVLVHGTPPKDETAEWNAQVLRCQLD